MKIIKLQDIIKAKVDNQEFSFSSTSNKENVIYTRYDNWFYSVYVKWTEQFKTSMTSKEDALNTIINYSRDLWLKDKDLILQSEENFWELSDNFDLETTDIWQIRFNLNYVLHWNWKLIEIEKDKEWIIEYKYLKISVAYKTYGIIKNKNWTFSISWAQSKEEAVFLDRIWKIKYQWDIFKLYK